MSMTDTGSMRGLRFHTYGEPAQVLRLEQAPIPSPGPGRARVRVQACGLNPADWALCRGLFAGSLPRGVGLDVAGIVDAVGQGVRDVAAGERVLGTADFAGYGSAGLADYAILDHWGQVPAGLGMVEAASLPMAVLTASQALDCLGELAGRSLLVHGAGTMMGFAAVQIALARGARVIASAGATYAARLRGFGAAVTAHGEGLEQRVRDIAGGAVDLVLDTSPPNGVLPELVRIAGGVANHVLTITDFAAAAQLGARNNLERAAPRRHELLGEFARLAAEGRFQLPVAGTWTLEDWRAALELSLERRAGGKLVILVGEA